MNKADRDLFIYGLQMGDLVQLHADPANIDLDNDLSKKVIVGYNYEEGDNHGWFSRGWYFRYIDSGTLGVYISRVSEESSVYYWAKFHKIHCDGVICIVHEKYLYPKGWQYDPTAPNLPTKSIKKAYIDWYSGSV